MMEKRHVTQGGPQLTFMMEKCQIIHGVPQLTSMMEKRHVTDGGAPTKLYIGITVTPLTGGPNLPFRCLDEGWEVRDRCHFHLLK